MFVKTTVFVTQHPTSIRERERARVRVSARETEREGMSERKRARRNKGEKKENSVNVVRHFSIIKTSDV